MRAAPTPAEAALWAILRRRALGGWKFRRQHPMVGYVVDFFCWDLMLAVEVDGGYHDGQREKDERRARHLGEVGVRVIRVRNEDVLRDPGGVARSIEAVCRRLAERGS